ncbi:unnamed protein product [Phytophthora lilii]|uniref:Unnamed protein product n=1 Tax=Phytophthora lilii TaxID=2077276 RepID=A0A9W6UCW1_9STRA|nr:unnamed protein product [Phytophthora lilii]
MTFKSLNLHPQPSDTEESEGSTNGLVRNKSNLPGDLESSLQQSDAFTSDVETSRPLKRKNSGRKAPRSDQSAASATESPLTHLDLERYAGGRSQRFTSRSRNENHSTTFNDFLWKRSNTSADLQANT